jgi:hypothetical protein
MIGFYHRKQHKNCHIVNAKKVVVVVTTAFVYSYIFPMIEHKT